MELSLEGTSSREKFQSFSTFLPDQKIIIFDITVNPQIHGQEKIFRKQRERERQKDKTKQK